jgi:hypothetical protein
MPGPENFFHPTKPERVAIVSAVPVTSKPDHFWVRVERGPRRANLTLRDDHGPVAANDLDTAFYEQVGALIHQGYFYSGQHALLEQLNSGDAAKVARTAMRVGWLKRADLVPRLIALGNGGTSEVCSILDALGMIGAAAALPFVRQQATRQQLARRRSAVEALRNLGDADGLADALKRSREQLAPAVRATLATDSTQSAETSVAALVAAVLKEPGKMHGITADYLYELATEQTITAVRELIGRFNFDHAYVWRYVKSIFKRSLLRKDPATFGLLSYFIERRGRETAGKFATIKSGLDGAQRHTRIFGRYTQSYLRRLCWRYLTKLARFAPDVYAHAAAEAIVHYENDDGDESGSGAFRYMRCYVLMRVLYGRNSTIRFNSRNLSCWQHGNKAKVMITETYREESFPDLWDAQPRAYLRLLQAASLEMVQGFAERAVRLRHRAVLEAATLDEVLPILAASYEPSVQLALGELERRFDPANPDWNLLDRLLNDGRALVQELGRSWLAKTAPLWCQSVERMFAYLTAPAALTRMKAAELIAVHLAPAVREALADALLALLRQPETSAGLHEAAGQVARTTLLAEMGQRLTTAELLALIVSGTPAGQALAGTLLGTRTDAVASLGLETISTLAQHPIAAVRRAAGLLIRAARAQLETDPSILFILVESEWDETRDLAFTLLRELEWSKLGLAALTGLLDSTRIDVQNLGRDLVLQHFPRLPALDLVNRLLEHPHPNMRKFALDLVLEHAPHEGAWLTGASGFFKAVLFDLWPSLPDKRRALRFLGERGLEDVGQAGAAAELLGELTRVHGRGDFEQALMALTRVQIAYPELTTAVQPRPEALR